MELTPTEPLGAHVETDLRDLTEDDVETLRSLLATHGVLVVGDQRLDDTDFVFFLRRFGELAFTEGETAVEGYPELNVISNVGRDRPPRSQFHVDTSYVSRPPAYTALRAVTVPEQGGQTLFSDQYRAWETLDDATRTRLEDRTVRHVMTGLSLDPDTHETAETEAEHRLARPHPLSGRVALYLSTPERCASVSGMDEEESAATVAALLEHSTREDNVLRHSWAPGDVVIWDNACVMHKADHTGVVGDRVMHRGMVAHHERSS